MTRATPPRSPGCAKTGKEETELAGNYDMLFQQSRDHFLSFDQEEMIDAFRLEHDSENLYFRILGEDAALDRETGIITCGAKQVGFGASCSAYDILSRAEKRPQLAGRWVGIAELGGITAISHSESLNDDLSALENDMERAKARCLSWGGIERKQGDVSFIVPMFDFFPVWLQFWAGEEELGIGARLNCLWDANTLDFMYYETTWYARGYLQARLMGKEDE